jgi:predicted phage terminase large subunit-like protein
MPAQEPFLKSMAFEGLYGGAAGGGKTDALVMAALNYINHPRYKGALFRRTERALEGEVVPRTAEWYPHTGGRFERGENMWVWPSGARIFLRGLERDDAVTKFQGWELQYIGWDELTHFSRYQYTYMLSRVRSAAGIPPRVRGGTNPGGEGHEWVMERWAPWLDQRPEYKGPRAHPGQKLWYYTDETGEHYCVDDEQARAMRAAWMAADEQRRKLMPMPLSRVFIPARAEDNIHLMAGDPTYVARLGGLDPLTRAQLRDGNWLARAARGVLFKRAWFDIVDAAPAEGRRMRYWDRASTAEPVNVRVGGRKAHSDPDYTVGVKWCRAASGLWYVEDVIRFRGRPEEVERTILQTAELDGRDVEVGLWKDPGQAGVFEAAYYIRKLTGYTARAYPQVKDKVTYAKPLSAQCEARNVKLVRGSWNEAFLQELEEFPEGVHDDQEDAAAGGFAALNGEPPADPGDQDFDRGERRLGSARGDEGWDDDD